MKLFQINKKRKVNKKYSSIVSIFPHDIPCPLPSLWPAWIKLPRNGQLIFSFAFFVVVERQVRGKKPTCCVRWFCPFQIGLSTQESKTLTVSPRINVIWFNCLLSRVTRYCIGRDWFKRAFILWNVGRSDGFKDQHNSKRE
jgi:hypothetical protein